MFKNNNIKYIACMIIFSTDLGATEERSVLVAPNSPETKRSAVGGELPYT